MEELGTQITGRFDRIGEYRQPGGKIVVAWSVEADLNVDAIVSNTFTLEWPPKSGLSKEFPEIDRAGWFSLAEAERKILKGQYPILSDFAAKRASR
jgi:predicted NUDIX family NTP pyrophosphohydrolase